MKFKLWLENIFGFEEEKPVSTQEPLDDFPVKAFSSDTFMTYLEKNLGIKSSNRPYFDTVVYGTGAGSVRIKVTPNLGVLIQRLITDLEGNSVWVTKKLFRIKVREFAGKEDFVAEEVYRHLKKIDEEKIDSGSKKYDKLFVLTKTIYDRVNKANPMFFQNEIKKVSENNYNILLSVANYGLGKLVGQSKSSATPAGVIDVFHDKKTGLIKGVFYTVSIEGESGAWEIDIPYFTGVFAPSQGNDEIANAIVNGVKFV